MANPRGVILRKNAGQTMTIDTWTALTWQTEEMDTDAFFTSGTSDTRITIPDIGDTIVVQLIAGVRYASSSAGLSRGIRITKNGSIDYAGSAGMHTTVNASASNYALVCATAPIIVVPGDYFIAEGWTANQAVATDTNSPRTFFACHVRALA